MSRIRDARVRIDAHRARVDAALARLQERRGADSFLGAALEAAETDRRRAGGLLAGGIAFRAFLWLLPAALVATGVLGAIRATAHEQPDVVARQFGLSGVVGSSVAGAVDQSSSGTAILIGSGLVLTMYFGISLVKALRIACVIAWDLPLVRRPHLVRDGVIISLALGAQITGSALASGQRGYSGPSGLVVTLGVALIACGLWLGIELLLPHGDAPISALVPGAIMMVLALELLYLATIYYFVRRLSTSSDLYGSLGVAATLLLWLFVIARVFVAAMFLDAALWKRTQARRAQAAEEPT